MLLAILYQVSKSKPIQRKLKLEQEIRACDLQGKIDMKLKSISKAVSVS